MVAAIVLDLAALLELLAPLTPPPAILPLACAANVLKNIGFLTASASRAAIHQSLAVTANLADVTAKTGSQSMAAGLLGTAVGVGLSSLLHHDATNFIAGFVGLAAIHQSCNYVALKAVSLRHFNRQRLAIVLDHYFVEQNDVSAVTSDLLTPVQVAEREHFLPFITQRSTNMLWLAIGSDLETVCPEGSSQLSQLLAACPGENYILNVVQDRIHLVFLEAAVGDDVILGVLHAYWAHHELQQQQTLTTNDPSPLYTAIVAGSSYERAKVTFPTFLAQLHAAGWNTGTDMTNVEDGSAIRLAIDRR